MLSFRLAARVRSSQSIRPSSSPQPKSLPALDQRVKHNFVNSKPQAKQIFSVRQQNNRRFSNAQTASSSHQRNVKPQHIPLHSRRHIMQFNREFPWNTYQIDWWDHLVGHREMKVEIEQWWADWELIRKQNLFVIIDMRPEDFIREEEKREYQRLGLWDDEITSELIEAPEPEIGAYSLLEQEAEAAYKRTKEDDWRDAQHRHWDFFLEIDRIARELRHVYEKHDDSWREDEERERVALSDPLPKNNMAEAMNKFWYSDFGRLITYVPRMFNEYVRKQTRPLIITSHSKWKHYRYEWHPNLFAQTGFWAGVSLLGVHKFHSEMRSAQEHSETSYDPRDNPLSTMNINQRAHYFRKFFAHEREYMTGLQRAAQNITDTIEQKRENGLLFLPGWQWLHTRLLQKYISLVGLRPRERLFVREWFTPYVSLNLSFDYQANNDITTNEHLQRMEFGRLEKPIAGEDYKPIRDLWEWEQLNKKKEKDARRRQVDAGELTEAEFYAIEEKLYREEEIKEKEQRRKERRPTSAPLTELPLTIPFGITPTQPFADSLEKIMNSIPNWIEWNTYHPHPQWSTSSLILGSPNIIHLTHGSAVNVMKEYTKKFTPLRLSVNWKPAGFWKRRMMGWDEQNKGWWPFEKRRMEMPQAGTLRPLCRALLVVPYLKAFYNGDLIECERMTANYNQNDQLYGPAYLNSTTLDWLASPNYRNKPIAFHPTWQTTRVFIGPARSADLIYGPRGELYFKLYVTCRVFYRDRELYTGAPIHERPMSRRHKWLFYILAHPPDDASTDIGDEALKFELLNAIRNVRRTTTRRVKRTTSHWRSGKSRWPDWYQYRRPMASDMQKVAYRVGH